MLFHLNYQFLTSQQAIVQKTIQKAKQTVQNPKLESPKHSDENAPIDHIVFVIHGIGQQTEQYGFFQKHLQNLHDTTNQAIDENYGYHSKPIRVKYIPIEWHKHIHDETNEAMDNITLRSVSSLRMVNNDYLADAFFYLSKDRGQSIIRHVTQAFNSAYEQFMNENPTFQGKIAILAYSLGGIITWDILSNQAYSTSMNSTVLTEEQRSRREEQYAKVDYFTFTPLHFKPDYLFTLGSPLSAFLCVRNQDPKYYRPTQDIIFENIFHPFDPLGYRFEPMLNDEYKHKPAVLIDEFIPSNTSIKASTFNKKPFSWTPFTLNTASTTVSSSIHPLSLQKDQPCISNGSFFEPSQGGCNDTDSSNTILGTLLSTVKRYFSTSHSSPQHYFPQQDEEEYDQMMYDSTLSTPKLSLDGSTISSDDEEELRSPIDPRMCIFERNHTVKDHSNSASYIAIPPHTDDEEKATPIFQQHNDKKRSFSTAALLPLQCNNSQKEASKHKRYKKAPLAQESVQLLNTTLTRSSPVQYNNDDHPNVVDKAYLDCSHTYHSNSQKRIDYVLRPERLLGGLLRKNEYMSGLTAHFSYWRNKDLMWHIVRRLENTNTTV